MKSCPYCDAPMSNPRRVQCGTPECKRAWQNGRMKRYYAAGKFNADLVCSSCSTPFQSRKYPRPEQCPPCAIRSQRQVAAARSAAVRTERARQRRLPVPFEGEVRRPGRVLAVVRPLRRCWYMGYCACCGQSFIHDQPHTRTCSARCAKRLQRDRRRALERDAFVVGISPRGIFERDRWTCQLCGTRVAWSKQVPHPRAPVIDHIVPLAAGPESGGVHAPWNVQTAHFLCNSIKCAEFDQAALF